MPTEWGELAGKTWAGKMQVVAMTTWDGCAVQKNVFDLNLLISIAPAKELCFGVQQGYFYAYGSKIRGTVHVSNPTVEMNGCSDQTGIGSVTYQPSDYEIVGSDAMLEADSNGFHVTAWDVKANTAISYRTILSVPGKGTTHEEESDLATLVGLPERIPITVMDSGHIQIDNTSAVDPGNVIHRVIPASAIFPKNADHCTFVIALKGDFVPSSDIDQEHRLSNGNAKTAKAMGGLIAALLGYLALVFPALIMNPESSDFMALFGTLIGSLESLKGLGWVTLAGQARLGGFAGAALAESFEIARLYQQSSTKGESGATTAARIGISAISDIIGFVASAAIMEAAIGAAGTAVVMVGPVAATVIAVGGAAALTYATSSAVSTVKGWGFGLINRIISK